MFGAKAFSADDIQDQAGKVYLVTGGTSGLGLETCRQLLKKNATVYFTARNPDKADAAVKEILGTENQGGSNGDLHVVHLDLSDLESVKKGADTFKAHTNRLDVLINNAGIMATPASTTKQGYEIQFGTNHMGHALLTKLLMPKLLETAKEPGADVRIVNLSSAGHQMPPKGGLVLKDVKSDMASTITWVRYGQSKLANVLFTRELARRFPTIKSMALHPGGINTGLSGPFQDAHPWLAVLMNPVRMLLTGVQDGALTQLFAATSPNAKSGQYYVPVAKESSGSTYSQDPKLAAELWDWTEAELAKLGYKYENK